MTLCFMIVLYIEITIKITHQSDLYSCENNNIIILYNYKRLV